MALRGRYNYRGGFPSWELAYFIEQCIVVTAQAQLEANIELISNEFGLLATL